MALFEALYGRKCQSPLYWGKLGRGQSVQETLDFEEIEEEVTTTFNRAFSDYSED
jgi:hypothetical protein